MAPGLDIAYIYSEVAHQGRSYLSAQVVEITILGIGVFPLGGPVPLNHIQGVANTTANDCFKIRGQGKRRRHYRDEIDALRPDTLFPPEIGKVGIPGKIGAFGRVQGQKTRVGERGQFPDL